jgi:phospholipid/cholesterol/gamma-HCH transport system ATP-binding protein
MQIDKPIIQVRNLTVQYDDTVVLDNISFEVLSGEIFVILGGSGCGKTTLMNNIIGLYEPHDGDVLIDGESIVFANEKDQKNILKKIGVMYQNGALFGSMTIFQNVCLPLEELTNLPMDAIARIARNKLAMVGLGNFCDYMPSEISGGMKKRAAIARAMALDPKILFLDEPSAGLDPITSAQLDQLILSLSQHLGITFVIVSHELPSIFNIAKRVIMLHNSKIIAQGIPLELKTHSNDVYVKQFFNRESVVTA